jgi:hypothetical protein
MSVMTRFLSISRQGSQAEWQASDPVLRLGAPEPRMLEKTKL